MYYCGDEHKTLLKKYSNDVTKLNHAIKQELENINSQEIQNDDCEIEMKPVYVGTQINDDLSQFCMKKNITKTKLAQLIKTKLLLKKR